MGKIFVFYGSGATATIDATKSKVLNFLYEAQVGLGYCKAGREERRVYLGSMDLKKMHDRVHREKLYHVLRMYDIGDNY